MFAKFQRADRALDGRVTTALADALISYVDKLEGDALGLDVFAALAADERVRKALAAPAAEERVREALGEEDAEEEEEEQEEEEQEEEKQEEK